MAGSDPHAVRAYYDANTAGFLRFGQGGSLGVIHRAVWAPGITDRKSAFRHVETLILEELAAIVRPEDIAAVLDLGCGVGSSLEFLARARGGALRGVGVTLSPVQVELARRRLAEGDLSPVIRCLEGDFTALPDGLGSFDLAYAIEAFVHGQDPAAFFREAARVLVPGGRLVICDDFVAANVDEAQLDARGQRWLAEFRRGWGASSLLSVEAADVHARAAGLERVLDLDLTASVELRRPRDHVIAALVTVGRYLPITRPWWRNLLGGNALQQALVRRILEYHFVVWRRPEDTGTNA